MAESPIVHRDTLEIVRQFVRDELCEKNQLERDAFEMSQRVLIRKGNPCGLYFCIHGPRSVRLSAVWDLQKEAIHFTTRWDGGPPANRYQRVLELLPTRQPSCSIVLNSLVPFIHPAAARHGPPMPVAFGFDPPYRSPSRREVPVAVAERYYHGGLSRVDFVTSRSRVYLPG